MLAGRSWGSFVRILFVGDHSCLPAELTGYVHDLGDDWQLQQADDAAVAIDLAARNAIDAVIVAPTLPDLLPATLLGQIRTLRPEATRIALLDAADGERMPSLRIISVAHRFLPLPLPSELLLEAVVSVEEVRGLLDDPRLRAAIGRIEKLPSPPRLYLELMQALEEERDAGDLAGLIAGDAAITAQVLQLCNSAFFSGGRAFTSLRAAVTRLGVASLRDLVLASEVFSIPAVDAVERAALQRRSLLASRIASRILPQSSAELGATAALLADIGLLLPGVRNQRLPAAGDDYRPGHTEAGAYLLGLWGLPMAIIEAVALHRSPSRSGLRSFWVTGAVHVATALASGEPVDEDYLDRVGMLARLPDWRELAETIAIDSGHR